MHTVAVGIKRPPREAERGTVQERTASIFHFCRIGKGDGRRFWSFSGIPLYFPATPTYRYSIHIMRKRKTQRFWYFMLFVLLKKAFFFCKLAKVRLAVILRKSPLRAGGRLNIVILRGPFSHIIPTVRLTQSAVGTTPHGLFWRGGGRTGEEEGVPPPPAPPPPARRGVAGGGRRGGGGCGR